METIADEAGRLTRLVENLLRLTQLTASKMEPEADWHPIDDVIGSALGRVSRLLGDRKVDVDVPADLPLVRLDPVLVEQALVNLLENAVRYAPPDGPIAIRAFRDGARLRSKSPTAARAFSRATSSGSSSRSIAAAPLGLTGEVPGWDWRSCGPSLKRTAEQQLPGTAPMEGRPSRSRSRQQSQWKTPAS